MKPSIITLLIGLLLLACKPINQPELCSGIIVGTICCLDTVNQRTMQGYYIITDKNDSILTFFPPMLYPIEHFKQALVKRLN